MTHAFYRAAVVFSCALALAAPGCNRDKKQPSAEVQPTTTSPPTPTPAETVLAPLNEPEAGTPEDAGVDAGVKKHTGVGTNQLRVKQCCSALRAQAKQLGASPEAFQLQSIAVTCDTIAGQLGASTVGQAPELAPLRMMLKGRTLPPVCQGL